MNKATTPLSSAEKKSLIKRVTIVGSIWDFLLGAFKVIIGILFHSHALVVDGIHSFTDVLSDIFVLMIARVSHEGPDKNHPYGHEKFETLGSVALGSLLLATAGALLYESFSELIKGDYGAIPGWPTLVIAALSLLVKEALFQYTYRAGEKANSPLIKANAWHSRTDALSSLVVLVGLGFTLLGYPWFDSVAAVIVSFIIAKIGFRFVRESLVELADTAIDEEKKKRIQKTIESVEGVKSCHALRTRQMGSQILIDVNIEVDIYLTASEAHEISAWTIKVLKEEYSEVKDVTVHTDVEDDRDEHTDNPYEHSFNDLLPLRQEVLKQLHTVWGDQNILDESVAIRLHYVKRKIQVELLLPLSPESSPLGPALLKKELQEKASHLDWFSKVTLLYVETGIN